MIATKSVIATTMMRSERRQERSPFSNLNPMQSPATTATKTQPQMAIPATANPIFKTQPMLIGR